VRVHAFGKFSRGSLSFCGLNREHFVESGLKHTDPKLARRTRFQFSFRVK
jgi:hypothetical protein